jgi:hypothetical protein
MEQVFEAGGLEAPEEIRFKRWLFVYLQRMTERVAARKAGCRNEPEYPSRGD